MALALGCVCAVFDDAGRVLITRSLDMSAWALPTARLRTGEALEDAAVRAVRESTGVLPHVDQVVGVYYAPHARRLDVLFTGWQLDADVSRSQLWRDVALLPETPYSAMIRAAQKERQSHPETLKFARQNHLLQYLRRGLQRLMRVDDPQFMPNVTAVGVIWDDEHRRIMTIPTAAQALLPRISCSGGVAPWDELGAVVAQYGADVNFRWVGLWQNVYWRRFEFVFAATMPEKPLTGDAVWTTARIAALSEQDAAYVERVKKTFHDDAVWRADDERVLRAGDSILGEWKR